MSNAYDPRTIEAKWRDLWAKQLTANQDQKNSQPKYYCLDMFPYPSGEGLHVGHWRGYVLSDVWSRYQAMLGKTVLHPMGWDAFGLPAENRAIKQGIHPADSTREAISTMKRQLQETGAGYDWDREINTSDPSYYRWTQWLFLGLYQRGLAYRAEAEVNWCPKDQTVLANEQVIDGRCERCDSLVDKKSLKQWFFKITAYADELLNFDDIDWPARVVTMQKNWIGKSEGARLFFELAKDRSQKIECFTTRPETVYGATFMVLAPEHPLVDQITIESQRAKVKQYREQAKLKTEIERTNAERDKTGVDTGAMAINPATNQPIPIWIADYVLAGYGTGAIMAVPAHDQRDYDFAQKYDLPIRPVIDTNGAPLPYLAPGKLAVEGPWQGQTTDQFLDKLLDKIGGVKAVNYRLRDWLISRQRYWGCPIPIIYCPEHGEVPVPADHLPVLLPHNADFQPGGESPLTRDQDFVQTTCPKCGQDAKRETDTIDTFVDSSWYFLRYADAKNDQAPFDKEKVEQWLPVDQYVGGIEHAILHLLYARFITKALADSNHINFREPFLRLFNIGMIYLNGKKMSKSKGNVVNPDELVARYGTDTLRGYEMFIAPADQDAEWNPSGVAGVYRFLHRVWAILNGPTSDGDETKPETHRLIQKVTGDLESFDFNTVVSALMGYINEIEQKPLSHQEKLILSQLLAPIFPHFAEESWQNLGQKTSIFISTWPTVDPDKLTKESVNFIVQENGKLRGTITAGPLTSQQELEDLIRQDPKLSHLPNKAQKTVFVTGRLINFVL